MSRRRKRRWRGRRRGGRKVDDKQEKERKMIEEDEDGREEDEEEIYSVSALCILHSKVVQYSAMQCAWPTSCAERCREGEERTVQYSAIQVR